MRWISSGVATMRPPVGKSGPSMWRSSWATVRSGFAIIATAASITSPRLWGGILVAMPTAMPSQPVTSRCGNCAGSTTGSLRCPSNVGRKSTVCFLISESSSTARGRSLHSV